MRITQNSDMKVRLNGDSACYWLDEAFKVGLDVTFDDDSVAGQVHNLDELIVADVIIDDCDCAYAYCLADRSYIAIDGNEMSKYAIKKSQADSDDEEECIELFVKYRREFIVQKVTEYCLQNPALHAFAVAEARRKADSEDEYA